MTIIPNFLITGILAVLIGLIILLWSAAYMQHKHGGIVLILLSVALLLFGGGFFPPLIGIIGGVAGIWINKSLIGKRPNIILRFGAGLWPWPLAIFLIWVFGQVVMGSLFNDFTQQIMGYGVLLILAMLPLSVFSAYAHDVQDFSGGRI
ncbi:MAG: hypothetical protein DWQ07_16045 [Chloroflexi bacterium]|nr:MAG: hypothetical protein DWQ07_16045 [Chloroflexota bacterium]MBL1195263.1 hypothetical protein [Chloroflexota bacterium]